MQRVLVYGVTGSGKTTMAAAISGRTGIPWHDVDHLMFENGWRNISEEEQRARVREICAGERWVLDTAYSHWIDVPLPRAQLVVALDYPRWVSLGRLLRRTARRVATKEKVCNGNVETVRSALLSRNGIIIWHFRSFPRKRARIREWQAAEGAYNFTLVRLASPRQAEQWLASLPRGLSSPPPPHQRHHVKAKN